jgi:hypothetical protein
VRIPVDGTLGQHQIVVSGADPDGVVRKATLNVVVVGASGASGASGTPLARTGSQDAPYLLFALGLLVAGSLLTRAAGRRPRKTAGH